MIEQLILDIQIFVAVVTAGATIITLAALAFAGIRHCVRSVARRIA